MMENAEVVTEEDFRKYYRYDETHKVSLRKRLAERCKCTRETALNLFPIAEWLPKYSAKEYLLSDVIAGVTVAIMHIPHGLSYAPLGGVEPVVGLYMAIFPVFMYMVLGTSRQISIGTFAIVCSMTGEIVHSNGYSSKSTTDDADAQPGTDHTALDAAIVVCLLVGAWQGLLGLLRLGILMVVMSNSLISGFTTGAACYVFSYQLKNLFGINVSSFTGPLKLFYLYVDFFSKIKNTNLMTLGISVGAIAVLVIFNELIKPLIKKKYPKSVINIPIELLVIVAGTMGSYFGDLSEKFGVRIVGHIPKGFPEPRVPPLGLLSTSPSIIYQSFIVAVVAVAVNLSLAKIFARKGGYTVSDNQELIAYGVANLFASFFSCLPSAASLSRSSIQFSTGGKTQLTSLFSIVLIVLIILFAGPLFEPVPYCILSAIVVVTLKSLLFQVGDLPKIWRESYWDGIVWLGTFLTVIIIDIDIGLAVGIALSVLTLTCSMLIIKVNQLGRVPNSDVYLDLNHYKTADVVSGVLILQVVGTINYANCNRFEKKVLKSLERHSAYSMEEPSHLVLDLSATARVDPTSLETLTHLRSKLEKRNCTMYFVACNTKVYQAFEKCGLFNVFPKGNFFPTLTHALKYITNNS